MGRDTTTRDGRHEGHGPFWRTGIDARRALWLVVATAFAVLLYENRDQWFGGDEWNIITDRGLTAGRGHLGLFEPHFEHWSTLPILAYRLLFSVFGLHSYLPYAVVLIVVHLTIVVLLWHVLVRSRVDPWVATFACAVFALLGTGFENLTGAWQAQLIAPLALGLGALLVIPQVGRFTRRDAVASLLLLAAVMCSGVALPMLIVVALVTCVWRGWRIALGIVAAPIVAYLGWYLAYGRESRAVTESSFGAVPDFVWRGTVDAFDDVAGIEAIGTMLVIAVIVWLAWQARRRRIGREAMIPIALVLGGVTFLASTGFRRANLFFADPAASRYAYVTIAFMLPLVALAASHLPGTVTLRRGVLAVVTIALLVVQVNELDREASTHAVGEQSDRGAVLATAKLAREGQSFLLQRPLYAFEPQVTVDEIVSMDRDGKLPGLSDATTEDRLTVLGRTQLVVGPEAAISGADPPEVTRSEQVTLTPTRAGVRAENLPGCFLVSEVAAHPEVVLRFPTQGVFQIAGSGAVTMRLRDERRRVEGEGRTFYLREGADEIVSVGQSDAALVVTWLPRGEPSQRGHVEELCDVTVP